MCKRPKGKPVSVRGAPRDRNIIRIHRRVYVCKFQPPLIRRKRNRSTTGSGGRAGEGVSEWVNVSCVRRAKRAREEKKKTGRKGSARERTDSRRKSRISGAAGVRFKSRHTHRRTRAGISIYICARRWIRGKVPSALEFRGDGRNFCSRPSDLFSDTAARRRARPPRVSIAIRFRCMPII